MFLFAPTLTLSLHPNCSASQALREGAAKLRKEGYGVKNKIDAGSKPTSSDRGIKRGLNPPRKILLPTERTIGESNDLEFDQYARDFDPPRCSERARKKIRHEAVLLPTERTTDESEDPEFSQYSRDFDPPNCSERAGEKIRREAV